MKKEAKSFFNKKTKKAETEEPEEGKLLSEKSIDIPDTLDDEIPAFENIDSSISELKDTESAPVTESEKPPEPEKTVLSNKQKIAALKRSIQNKQFSLEREQTKVRDWRIQGNDRINKATATYEKRKAELQDALSKTEERFNKSIAKTQKLWLDYADNFEQTKIKKIEDDLTLLQSELSKIEEIEPTETK